MKQFGIPSVSPELGNDDFFSNDFFLKYDVTVRGVLRDNHPWIYHTFKKMAGELQVDPTVNATRSGSTYSFHLKNIGLQDWEEGHSLYYFVAPGD